ncbi:glycosyl hydrolase family 28 protein [Pseudovibrio sp. Tun.PSC04-5.I4]|uniref:glycoside hydrolase family 28 protein n=1 Tax=Pseudovibrio sp. Tun.PSC04-5.I4 TaxID=1798213 RepID=UPI00087F246C|nr:glycosyl hydrolase family 28 protein [Pseudovibrio sp. Tun.PSC04-5.I4]SDQ12626.1 Polygalacturonase [Pseudovibrio sp. Tun.PSC04-5.I4]
MSLNIHHVTVSNGAKDITRNVQQAIDEVHAAGGGQVVLPRGQWVSKALKLKSYVDLHLPNGCELSCSTNYDELVEGQVSVIAEDSDRAFITARDQQGISISGSGAILGHSSKWCSREGLFEGTLWPKMLRPRIVVFENCKDVSLTGISILEAPMWTIHLIACHQVKAEGLRILNDMRMPNTDGINFDSCTDASVLNCIIRAADDAICVKTCRKEDERLNGPAERIIVSNSNLSSRSCALKIGTETYQDVRDVLFTTCTITESNRAFGIFSRDGGNIERIRFSNCTVQCEQTPDGFWGSGEAITINTLPRIAGDVPGYVRDVSVDGITGRAQGAINIVGHETQQIENVSLSNIQLSLEQGKHSGAYYLDLRPSPHDVNVLDNPDEGRRNAWVKNEAGEILGLEHYPNGLPAVWLDHAQNIRCTDVVVHRPDPLPRGWSDEPVELGRVSNISFGKPETINNSIQV